MSREDFIKSLSIKKDSQKSYTGKKLDFNKLKSSVQKKIAVGLMAAIIITGFAGCAQKAHEEPTISSSQSTTIDPYENLNSGGAILTDFKERYIKEYNEKNGTEYSASQIKLNVTHPSYLFKTGDGKLVTHGDYPYQTEDVLKQYGSYTSVDSQYDIDLYQITLDGEHLEAYANYFSRDGEYVDAKPVLSGNDLNSLLDNLKDSKECTLSDLSEACEAAVEASSADKFTDTLKQDYIDAIEESKEENSIEH